MSIRRLIRKDIDTEKWNRCVEQSTSPLIYGTTHYLDQVCPRWIGLVKGDYEAVMPVPLVLRKVLRVVGMPLFCQQLGVFSPQKITDFGPWLAKISKRPFSNSLSFNYFNPIEGEERVNLVVNLERPLEDIRSKFNQNTKRNIKKGAKLGLDFSDRVRFEQFVALHRAEVATRDKALTNKAYQTLRGLYEVLSKRGEAYILGLHSQDQLVSTILFTQAFGRLIYLAAATRGEYKKSGANHLLVDQAIEHFHGQVSVLDFEGSSIPGIARFFRGFGAEEENYTLVKI